MIETRGLKKRYSDGTYALKGISLKLDKRITCILGRNGAGKTTLIRILSTQLMPTSGTANIDGYAIVKEAKEVRNIICSIPQEAEPIGVNTPIEHCILYLLARGMNFREASSAANKALKSVGIYEARNKASDELSGGMKRKIFVAMALASKAKVIFLDEPTTGLDPLSRIEVWSAIRELKSQVILSTHYMEEATALSDDVVLIEDGRLMMHGSVNELLKPYRNKVRVEGTGAYKVGNTRFSYIGKRKAKSVVGKNFTIKPVTLDDLFIMRGVKLED